MSMVTKPGLPKIRTRGLILGRHNSVNGTWGRTRTDTPVKEPDFESGASTSFATQAERSGILHNLIQSYNSVLYIGR